ncbi:hypothetical protein [Paraburkholderia sediminicola]|uniref:hypothetical protein n=1 Tax=Paraburkholderia sediminicola TaxID=458836 RepID=UPI0038BAD754
MLSFFVINLLIPGDPDELAITTPEGPWKLIKMPSFAETKAKIAAAIESRPKELPVGETYYLENATGMDSGAAAAERAFDEITPILLAASFATGMAVTINRSTMGSSVAIVQPSDHWPRARALGSGAYVVSTADEFRQLVETYPSAEPVLTVSRG